MQFSNWNIILLRTEKCSKGTECDAEKLEFRKFYMDITPGVKGLKNCRVYGNLYKQVKK